MMRHSPWTLLGCAAVVLLASCAKQEEAPPAPRPEAAPAVPAEVGTITGVVTYADGDPDTVIKMDADPVCQGLHAEPVMTRKVVTDEAGNLANVFVYVKEGLAGSYPNPAEKKILDQQGCQYHPHVSGIMVGQTLVIRNSDPTLHNIHAMPAKNREFNQGQPFEGMEMEKKFDAVEIMVPFKCDVHPWMSSYLGVLDHPFFAVSAEDGSFAIEELPAGTYTLEAWHESLGTASQEVTVEPGATVEVNFDFAPEGAAVAPAG